MSKTLNTYIWIYFIIYPDKPEWNNGRLVTSNEKAGLDLHVDIPLRQAKAEMAKLMLRTGKKPSVHGSKTESAGIMYSLSAFLD